MALSLVCQGKKHGGTHSVLLEETGVRCWLHCVTATPSAETVLSSTISVIAEVLPGAHRGICLCAIDSEGQHSRTHVYMGTPGIRTFPNF
jgi:hypothetical protein